MRRQLPVYSPLSAGAIASAAVAAVRDGEGERAALARELQERFDARQVVLTASGTQALQLALSGLPAADDGVVVGLPGYSCYDLVTAAVGAGVQVRFYDVDPVTLTPDVGSVRDVLRRGVSAVVAANLYGYPLNWGDLRAECEAAGVVLIEDAAQGIGTVSDNGPGGTLGDATVLSFGRGKGWTGGGGGALLLRDDGVRRRSAPQPQRGRWGARNLLTTGAAWTLGRPSLYAIPTSVPGLGLGETHYRDPTDPQVATAFSAALARQTADAATSAIKGRRHRATRLMELLSVQGHVPGHLCEPEGGAATSAFLRLAVVLKAPTLAESRARSGRELGMERGYPQALHHLPQSAPLQASPPRRLRGAEALASSLVTLPTHDWVNDRHLEALATALGGDPDG